MRSQNDGRRAGSLGWGRTLLTVFLGIGLVGCDSLIDVENPNNVKGEDLLDPAAAASVASGALYTVSAGYSYMLSAYSAVSDEVTWVGSRDAWLQLDQGTPDNPENEFVDAAFGLVGQGRWMSREAIKILETHRDSNRLKDINILARAYLYAALSYTTIADWFDDFAFSDRTVAGPPIGEANMVQLYDTAIVYLSQGLAIATNATVKRNLLAARARARHARGIWTRIGTRPINIASPLVSDAQADQDAADALAADNSDWKYQFEYSANTVWDDMGWQINARLELRFGPDYICAPGTGACVAPAIGDKRRDTTRPDRGVRILDPIDAVFDPRLDAIMTAFEAEERYADLTVLSAREMLLIRAEHALANGQTANFATHINAVRSLDGLSDWVDGGGGMPTAQNMLIHERRVNLYLQGRRLNDMYRFGIQSGNWLAGSSAVTAPGTFLPITITEIRANCFLNPDWPADQPCP
jgi:hypothetical protein